jgi:hypothetical protein
LIVTLRSKQGAFLRLLAGFGKASTLEAEDSKQGFLSFPFQSSGQKPSHHLGEGKQESKQRRKGKASFLGFCGSSGSFHTFPSPKEADREKKACRKRKLPQKASQDGKKKRKGFQSGKLLGFLSFPP